MRTKLLSIVKRHTCRLEISPQPGGFSLKQRSMAWYCSFFLASILLTVGVNSHAQQKTAARAGIIGALQRGDNQAASSLATQALDDHPRDCGLLSLKAVALANLAQSQAALEFFQKALVYCPKDLAALEGAVQIEYAKQSSGVVPLLARILVIDPHNVVAHAMFASTLLRQNKCDEALPHFEASKALFASRPDLSEGYGSCLAKTGDLKASLVEFERLLASNPNDKIRYNVAVLRWKTHDNENALATLEPLLEAHNEAAFSLASKVCEEKGDTPRAVDLLRTAILLAPDRSENYLDFADMAFTHKSFQVGIEMLNAGLKRLPGAAPLYVARGVLQVQLSRNDDAIADFEQAHRLDPTSSFDVDALGIVKSQQHQGAQSLALFESQVKLHPDDALLQYLLAEQLSEHATDPGNTNLAAAIAAAKRAATLEPQYKAPHDLLAVLYLRAKQPVQAIEEAELALAIDPADQNALYQEIIAKRRSGQTSEIERLVARFNELRKENEQRQANIDRYHLQSGVYP